jgi:hypothetical protein
MPPPPPKTPEVVVAARQWKNAPLVFLMGVTGFDGDGCRAQTCRNGVASVKGTLQTINATTEKPLAMSAAAGR